MSILEKRIKLQMWEHSSFFNKPIFSDISCAFLKEIDCLNGIDSLANNYVLRIFCQIFEIIRLKIL